MIRANLLLCLLFALSHFLFAPDTSKTKPPAQPASRVDTTRPAAAQPADSTQKPEKDETVKIVLQMIATAIGVAGFLFGLYQYRMRHRNKAAETSVQLLEKEKFEERKLEKQQRTAEELYRDTLAAELGHIKMLGSPEIESLPVKLLDTFVSLTLSETWRSETRFAREPNLEMLEGHTRNFPPEKVLQRAFQKDNRLLLIIGDPGSGKTTLMKYFAMSCLDAESFRRFGFDRPHLPIYFPLRELEVEKDFPDNLAKWASEHGLKISALDFYDWLHQRPTLILLDGLDEISNLEDRRKVCDWIDKKCAGLRRGRFIVTSRWTGYRKADGIELSLPHWRADVRDFTPDQQQDFLHKWFRNAYLRELPEENAPRDGWEARQLQLAAKRAGEVLAFLQKPENHSLRQLAATPMLLQIMAIIWKTRENLPAGRAPLYNASVNYLLAYRDARRKLSPVLPAEKARRVLAPVALWMQKNNLDAVRRDMLHERMQPILETMDERPPAEKFCANLRDRAGLLVDCGLQEYLFRHKSFREFFAAEQLAKECHQPERLQELISHFGEDWWEEPLRFFICLVDDAVFDQFMQIFFAAPVSAQLDQKRQKLLRTLVTEAPQKRVDSLAACLQNDDALPNRQRYALDCLKLIASPAAKKAVQDFVSRALVESKRRHETKMRSTAENPLAEAQQYAEEILAEWEIARPAAAAPLMADLFRTLPKSFRNPWEDNAEYILIPAGRFNYSVSKKIETVSNLYLAKYPVTNKRYRRFMAYLNNENQELSARLPREQFDQLLLAQAKKIEGFIEYLGDDPKKWAEKCQPYDDKRFNGDDQPAVNMTWFAATAYCHWLTALQQREDKSKNQIDSYIYRLPQETEWEWAASGGKREFPWVDDEQPDDTRANYDKKVGHTTPVGDYPKGATPEGLMDVAGNVWEWCENLYGEGAYRPDARALRGGSYYDDARALRCASRGDSYPDGWNDVVGFRVLCAQS